MTCRTVAVYKHSRLGDESLREPPTAGDDAALPRPRAFVVQLASDAKPASGTLRGRAVHIASGEAALFESIAELLHFIQAAIARAEAG